MNWMSDQHEGVVFQHVWFGYDGHDVLSNVSFCAYPGQVTVLFGPSGSVKTTCLRLVAGLEQVNDGEIYLSDRLVSSKTKHDSPRSRGVGFCFQDDGLWPNMSVLKHLEIVFKQRGNSLPNGDSTLFSILKHIGLQTFKDRTPNQLSGGERKRLALARALCIEPRYLLLDEPLSSVEGPMRDDMIELLHSTTDEDRCVLLVTHQLEEAFALGDRIVLLYDGRVLQEGPIREVFLNPQTVEAARLLGYRNFVKETLHSGEMKTPFGVIHHHSLSDDVYDVALLPDDLEVILNENGIGRIVSCRPWEDRFRVRVLYDGQTFLGVCSSFLDRNASVDIRCKKTPVLIREKT